MSFSVPRIVFHFKKVDEQNVDEQNVDEQKADDTDFFSDLGYFMRKEYISKRKWESRGNGQLKRTRQDRRRDRHTFYCEFCRNRKGGINCFPPRKPRKSLGKQTKKHPDLWKRV